MTIKTAVMVPMEVLKALLAVSHEKNPPIFLRVRFREKKIIFASTNGQFMLNATFDNQSADAEKFPGKEAHVPLDWFLDVIKTHKGDRSVLFVFEFDEKRCELYASTDKKPKQDLPFSGSPFFIAADYADQPTFDNAPFYQTRSYIDMVEVAKKLYAGSVSGWSYLAIIHMAKPGERFTYISYHYTNGAKIDALMNQPINFNR